MTEVLNLDAAAAHDLCEAGACLVDVREDHEWEAGHAPNAIHITLSTLPDNLELILKDSQIVTVCRSGGRSYQAALFLADHGYEAINLAGGMTAWSEGGFSVVDDNGEPGKVV